MNALSAYRMIAGKETIKGEDLISSEIPIVNLILSKEEHGNEFLTLLKNNLNDSYPNSKILCLYTEYNENFLHQINELELKHSNLKFIKLKKEWNGEKIGNVLQKEIIGNIVFWVKGNHTVFSKVTIEGKSYIQKYETVSDYFNVEPEIIIPKQPYPNFISISLTEKCNYTCFFCRISNHNMLELPLEKFYSLKPIIQNANILDITGWGEPLSYKHIKEALRFINKFGKRDNIQITTNASLLTEELAELLSKNLHKMIISINAATKETYERDMVNGKWERVLSNIKNARRYIPGEKIVLSFVGHRDNIEEFPQLVNLAAELGIKTVSLTHLIVSLPKNVRKSLWFFKEKTNNAVNQARILGQKLNVLVGGRSFFDPFSSAQNRTCNFPTTEVYISRNGDVGPCCFSEGNHMGNINMMGGFEKVWNGKKYRRLRKERYFPECKTCVVVSDPNLLRSHLRTSSFSEAFELLPKISIVIQAFEQIDLVKKIIDRLIKQTYPIFEVIVITDNVLDNTFEEFYKQTKLLKSQIRLVENSKKDVASAFNEGINYATGKYLCFLTIEHQFHDDKLEVNLKSLENLEEDFAVNFESMNSESIAFSENEFEDINLFSSMFRTDIIKKMNGFDETVSNPIADLFKRIYLNGYKFNKINNLTTINMVEYLIIESENLINQSNIASAIDKLQIAIEINPKSSQAHFKLGIIYLTNNQYEKMTKHFDIGIKLEPNNKTLVDKVIKIYKTLGKQREADIIHSDYIKNNLDDNYENSIAR